MEKSSALLGFEIRSQKEYENMGICRIETSFFSFPKVPYT